MADGSVQSTDIWPLPAFHFQVFFLDVGLTGVDSAFQDISGIGSQIETEEYREGGSDNFVYHLPKSVKFSNLVLKRGICSVSSPLMLWCQDFFTEGFSSLTLRDLSILLLDEKGFAVRTWHFIGAYPVNWKIDSFNSTKNEVAIEEIELCYNHSFRIL
ncbi:MAG: phage tail-like protein [Paraglaciecola sp.]|jgi:phage tail-like protein